MPGNCQHAGYRVFCREVARYAGAGYAGQRHAVCSRGIGACLPGGARCGNHVAFGLVGRAGRTRGGRVAVVQGCGFVVAYCDCQRRTRLVAIAFRNHDLETVGADVTLCGRGKGVAVGHGARTGQRIIGESGDGQYAVLSGDGLARARYRDSVQCHALQSVFGVEGDRAGGGFAVGCRVAAAR